MPVTTIEFGLPFPISVNRIWRAARGRVYKSKEYQAWIAEAHGAWLQQKSKLKDRQIIGLYKIDIGFHFPDKRHRDLGNLEKGISDLCEALGIIENDCQCVDQHLWVATKEQAPYGSCVKIESVV